MADEPKRREAGWKRNDAAYEAAVGGSLTDVNAHKWKGSSEDKPKSEEKPAGKGFFDKIKEKLK